MRFIVQHLAAMSEMSFGHAAPRVGFLPDYIVLIYLVRRESDDLGNQFENFLSGKNRRRYLARK
jgi:hypothetical protein